MLDVFILFFDVIFFFLAAEAIGEAEVQVEVDLEGVILVLIPILGPVPLHIHVHHPALTHALDPLGLFTVFVVWFWVVSMLDKLIADVVQGKKAVKILKVVFENIF